MGISANLLNNIAAIDAEIDGSLSIYGESSVKLLVDRMRSSQIQKAACG